LIFLTLGSQKFQFNRLLIWIDELIEEGKITTPVFAQIGWSDYQPKNYSYKKFLDRSEFIDAIEKSHLIITHGGTGAIITGLKHKKKVIAVARKKEFLEHVDNHQNQIVSEFCNINFIEAVENKEELEKAIHTIKDKRFDTYVSSTQSLISAIENFIESEEEG